MLKYFLLDIIVDDRSIDMFVSLMKKNLENECLVGYKNIVKNLPEHRNQFPYLWDGHNFRIIEI